jgi:malate dehydrogenase (oxaloacetate-decarboxylating)(NADP+)
MTKRGFDVLADQSLNKATAFTSEERDALGLRGLLPAAIVSQSTQLRRALENVRRKHSDIDRYVFLMALEARNERLFYRLLLDHIDEILPLVYTPTVGQACREFAHHYRQQRAMFLTPDDRGRIRSLLDNWPERDVRMIVVTDGERILGLGDLGANGIGIPIGKLKLYSAFAGIHPDRCLPVILDVGTNNETLRGDPLYLGVSRPRITGDAYLALVDEFVAAVQDAFPKALVQFEDFLTPNAYALLARYRDRVLCFNDDIQGTAAVALAGVYASTRISNVPFRDLRVMFLGAGSAATGIADLMVRAFVEAGLSEEAARRRLWFVDLHGLVVEGRDHLLAHNLPYAHPHARMGFVEAMRSIAPHVLIGATGAPGTFTEEVVRTMAELNERPAIFALSNPTSRAECTAEDAYRWSSGRAIFASGSPFAPVVLDGRRHVPGQGNNAYVFPGLGLGVLAAEATTVTDDMFLAAAHAVADLVTSERLEAGTLYPPLSRIREVSLEIAVRVAELAFREGLARAARPNDLRASIAATMFDPVY